VNVGSALLSVFTVIGHIQSIFFFEEADFAA
jgi:hypothetical protein